MRQAHHGTRRSANPRAPHFYLQGVDGTWSGVYTQATRVPTFRLVVRFLCCVAVDHRSDVPLITNPVTNPVPPIMYGTGRIWHRHMDCSLSRARALHIGWVAAFTGRVDQRMPRDWLLSPDVCAIGYALWLCVDNVAAAVWS